MKMMMTHCWMVIGRCSYILTSDVETADDVHRLADIFVKPGDMCGEMPLFDHVGLEWTFSLHW